MIESDVMPANSFRETGFYIEAFPNWRYTGQYGLVKHNIPMNDLPKPYGVTEEIDDCIKALPIYMIEQVAETFRAFAKNITTDYAGTRSYTDDLKLLPYALVDFLPALFTAIAASLAVLWLPIISIVGSYNNRKCFLGDLILATAVIFSPLTAVAGALFGAWEMLAATLMFAKAGLEVGFAAVNILSIPLKAIESSIFNSVYKPDNLNIEMAGL